MQKIACLMACRYVVRTFICLMILVLPAYGQSDQFEHNWYENDWSLNQPNGNLIGDGQFEDPGRFIWRPGIQPIRPNKPIGGVNPNPCPRAICGPGVGGLIIWNENMNYDDLWKYEQRSWNEKMYYDDLWQYDQR